MFPLENSDPYNKVLPGSKNLHFPKFASTGSLAKMGCSIGSYFLTKKITLEKLVLFSLLFTPTPYSENLNLQRLIGVDS